MGVCCYTVVTVTADAHPTQVQGGAWTVGGVFWFHAHKTQTVGHHGSAVAVQLASERLQV